MKVFNAKAVCIELQTEPKNGMRYMEVTFRVDNGDDTDYNECFKIRYVNSMQINYILYTFERNTDGLFMCVTKIDNQFKPVTLDEETGEYVVV